MSQRAPFDLSTFDHHAPTEDQLRRIEAVRAEFKRIAAVILQVAPESRHRSLGLTALEEGAMWAIKSIVLEET